MSVLGRFEAKFIPEPNSGCWLWTASVCSGGYGTFRLDGKTEEAHRVSWALYVGPIPDGAHVLHRCDVPPCVFPGHLFLGNNAANVADRVAKGRSACMVGERNANGLLTEEQVLAIFADPRSRSEIAAEYGISVGHVVHVKAGKPWTHLLAGRVATRIKHQVHGEHVAQSKLTEAAVRAILADRRRQLDIAADYGVSQVAVSCIKRGKTWRHISGL